MRQGGTYKTESRKVSEKTLSLNSHPEFSGKGPDTFTKAKQANANCGLTLASLGDLQVDAMADRRRCCASGELGLK